jgi:hypothetical protein
MPTPPQQRPHHSHGTLPAFDCAPTGRGHRPTLASDMSRPTFIPATYAHTNQLTRAHHHTAYCPPSHLVAPGLPHTPHTGLSGLQSPITYACIHTSPLEPCTHPLPPTHGLQPASPHPPHNPEFTLRHDILKGRLRRSVLRAGIASTLEPPLHRLPSLTASAGISADGSAVCSEDRGNRLVALPQGISGTGT